MHPEEREGFVTVEEEGRELPGFRRSLVASALSVLLLVTLAPSAFAYVQNVYNATYGVKQTKGCWCVVATAKTWLRYQRPDFTVSQSDINSYVTFSNANNHHDKFDWTTKPKPFLKCTTYGGTSFAHDSRGLAWAMYKWSTAGKTRYFNDYRFGTQFLANRSVIWNILASGRPVAATVGKGAHEALVVGYQTDVDPTYGISASQINGFFVWDPWGFGGTILGNETGGHWITGANNAYYSISTWNTYIFLGDTKETGPEDVDQYYVDRYVIVAQKLDPSPPEDSPGPSYGDDVYPLHGPPPEMVLSSGSGEEGQGTVEDALHAGLIEHDLVDNPNLGVDLSTYEIGSQLRVETLDPSMSPYVLVELKAAGRVVAVAMVTEVADGVRFGAVLPVTGDTSLPSAAELRASAPTDLDGPRRVVWDWTDAGNSPFAPMVAVRDPASGRERYFARGGDELSR